jgi:hypothetical protein
MGACSIGVAIALLAISLSRVVMVTAASLVVFGFCFFLLSALITTVVVLATADEYRGRVMGFLSMANAGIVPVNAVAAGFLASFIGPQWTVGMAATLLLTFSIWFIAAGKLSLVVGAGEEVEVDFPLPDATAGLDVLGLPSALADLGESASAPT